MSHSININIDELLEEWKIVREISCPTDNNMTEVIVHEFEKNKVDLIAQNFRQSRLENNNFNEDRYAQEFADAYFEFTREFVFRVLKSR